MIPVVRVALLDANVLFPFTLRDTLLRAAAAGLFQVRWSDEILTETTRNLVAKGRATAANRRRHGARTRDRRPGLRPAGRAKAPRRAAAQRGKRAESCPPETVSRQGPVVHTLGSAGN